MMRALVCALGLVSGCSFLTVRGVPSYVTMQSPVPCTESPIAPILDTVPAVGFLGGSTLLFVEASRQGGGHDSPAAALVFIGLLGVLASVPFVASAAYGYVKTGRCREMNRSLRSPPPPPAGAATSP